jgi:hypothetical protein
MRENGRVRFSLYGFCIHHRNRTKANPCSKSNEIKQRQQSTQRLRYTYSGEVRLLDHLGGLTVDSLDEHDEIVMFVLRLMFSE